nr:hypothetical protein BaRGS_032757 [Batillaria attramentaria]
MATTGAGNSTWIDMFGWTYLGVDFTLPGNGGRECVDFLSPRQRLLESLVASLFAAFIVWLAYPRLTLPATEPKVLTEKETSGKRLLLLPFETEVYYIQHMLMLVIPFYLMHLGDPYIPERLSDFSWAATTFGLLFIYHFFPLQLLAMATQVNLNNMLCPAVSDPFHGPYYRLFAIAHQVLLIPSLGKIYAALARRLGWCPFEPESSVADLIKEEMSARDAASSDFGVNAAGGGQSANSSPHSRGDSHGEEKNRVHRYTDKGKHSPGNSNCSAAHNKMNGGARSEDGYLMQQSGGDVAHTANGHLKKQ